MKYICFFDDGQFYYCYSEDGKIYRGLDSESFTPNFKYFIALVITTIIGDFLNDFLQDRLNSNVLYAIIVLFGIIISITFGFITYRKIIVKADQKLTEIFLSDEQFKDYIIKGKKRFSIQGLILYIFIISSVFSFLFFYFDRNILIWFLGVGLSYVSALIFPWINPIKKHRFYKTITTIRGQFSD